MTAPHDLAGNTATTPDTDTTPTERDDLRTEIAAHMARLSAWQAQHKLSDKALIGRFPTLSSTKTLWRFRSGQWQDLDMDTWLAKLRDISDKIAEAKPLQDREAVIESLSNVQRTRLAVLAAQSTAGNSRLVLIEGDNGCGKTTALECITAKYGGVILQGSVTWKDRPGELLLDLLLALGQPESAARRLSAANRKRAVLRLLKGRTLCVGVDEAHHLGPACLNAIKELITETTCVFLLAAMHTLWERLEMGGAFEELRQLTGNRLGARIKLHKPGAVDARRLLQNITGMAGEALDNEGELAAAASTVLHWCKKNGNLKLVRRVAETARDIAAGRAVCRADIETALAQELDRR